MRQEICNVLYGCFYKQCLMGHKADSLGHFKTRKITRTQFLSYVFLLLISTSIPGYSMTTTTTPTTNATLSTSARRGRRPIPTMTATTRNAPDTERRASQRWVNPDSHYPIAAHESFLSTNRRSEQVPGADVRVPGEAARLRGGVRAELPHAGEALPPRSGDRRRPLQGQFDQDSRQVHTVFTSK